MINKVITGIALAIKTIGDYKVHTSDVKQNLKAPCFLVKAINVYQNRTLSNRFSRYQTFSITYIPKSNDEDEVREIAEKLLFALEYITVDGSLTRGTGIKCDTSDGALVCTVDYNVRLGLAVEKDKMQTVATKGKVK